MKTKNPIRIHNRFKKTDIKIFIEIERKQRRRWKKQQRYYFQII